MKASEQNTSGSPQPERGPRDPGGDAPPSAPDAPPRSGVWNRRAFLESAGFLGLWGGLRGAAPTLVAAEKRKPTPPKGNLTYDVDALRRVDPKLIHYEQTGRWTAPDAHPHRLVCAPDQRLWVSAGRALAALDAQGSVTTRLQLTEDIQCFAPAGDRVYVGLRDHVEVLDLQGKRLATWVTPAAKTWLCSITASAQDIFATDAGNRVVLRYDRDGQLRGRLGAKEAGKKRPGFVVPSPYFDLELTAEGVLWVVNPGEQRLEAYDLNGTLQTSWGAPSYAIEGFCGCCNPSFFTRLADGRFVTSEKGLNRIKVYSATGAFESVVAGPDQFPQYAQTANAAPPPLDIAADAAGRIYVADDLGGEVRIYQRKAKT